MTNLFKTTKQLADAREKTKEASVRAVRDMLSATQKALDGKKLRGAPSLGRSTNPYYYGARVHGRYPEEKLPEPQGFHPGRAVLCINDRAKLVRSHRDGNIVHEAAVILEEMRVEDLEKIASTLSFLLHEHLRAVGKKLSKYNAIRKVAERISTALGEDDDG